MKKIINFLLLILIGTTAWAQADPNADTTKFDFSGRPTYDVQILARGYGDSVVLRWAPESDAIWLLSNYYGWNLERQFYNPETGEMEVEELTEGEGNTILPITLKAMMERFDSTNRQAGLAAQALYSADKVGIQGGNEELMNMISNRTQEQTQRQMIAYMAAEESLEVAKAIGLAYVDKNVKKGVKYYYILRSRIPSEDAHVAAARVEVENEKFTPNPYRDEVNGFSAIQDEGRVMLFTEKNNLSGYYIEYKTAKSNKWNKLNDAPIYGIKPEKEEYEVFGDTIATLMESHVVTFDSIPINVEYQYRARGFDPFGRLSNWSEPVTVMLHDIDPPSIPILMSSVVSEDNTTTTIRWYKDEIEPDFKGYMLGFSQFSDGPFQKASEPISKYDTVYVDKEAGKRGRGFYCLFATDEYGNASRSNIIMNNVEDVTPPSKPVGLWGAIDTNGIVYLEWVNNPEFDLRGYHVYWANQKDHEFAEVSRGTIRETNFLDTIEVHTPTRHVYYYVQAVDFRNNRSECSDTLEILRPDFIAPSAPVLVDAHQDGDTIYLTWNGCTDEDMKFYYIYRKPQTHNVWELVKTINAKDLGADQVVRFMDVVEPSRTPYLWSINAIDEAGLNSGRSGQALVRVQGPTIVEIEKIACKASLDAKSNAVRLDLDWKVQTNYEYYGIVHRKVGNEDWKVVGNFTRHEKQYFDYNAPKGQTCQYYIELYLGKSQHSQPSKTVSVKVK